MKNQKGITLIALVITIIVLLILAGVSISMVIGNNGILNQASTAGRDTKRATEKEQVEMAFVSAKMKQLRGEITAIGATALATELKEFGIVEGTDFTVSESGEILTVKFIKSGNEYPIEDEIVKPIYKDDVVTPPQQEPTQPPVVEGTREDWEVSADGTLTKFKGTFPADGKITIPNVVDGVSVKKIETAADDYLGRGIFLNEEAPEYNSNSVYCSRITEITISEGIEEIGKCAFSRITSLKSVNIPATVKIIGVDAFIGCTSLEQFVIPDGVTTIGYQAFRECSALQKIFIPSSVDTIDTNIFESANSTCTIYIDASEKKLGWKDNWNNNLTLKYNETLDSFLAN